MAQLILRELTPDDEVAFKKAVREFAADSDWGFAFDFDEDANFAEYTAHLKRGKQGLDLPDGWVPATYLVGIVERRIVGRISLRHELNEFLREREGHVGYGVVPSSRRKGYATEMLNATLPLARELGINRLLVTCDDDNVGSIGVIEGCGGVLEDVRKLDGMVVPKRRYWLSTGEDPERAEGNE